jgi:hypothetical protein
VNANMFAQLVGRVEAFEAVATFKGADLKVSTPMITKEGSLGELLATFQALEGSLLVVTGHVLRKQVLISEGSVTFVAYKLAVLVGHDVADAFDLARLAGARQLLLDFGRACMKLSSVQEQHFSVIKDDVTTRAFVFGRPHEFQVLEELWTRFKYYTALVTLKKKENLIPPKIIGNLLFLNIPSNFVQWLPKRAGWLTPTSQT